MAQRGRKSAAALSVVSADALGEKRLQAPVSLTDAEKAIWLAVIDDNPATAFTETHAPVLEMYCRHVIRGGVLNAEILKFNPKQLSNDDGLKRYDKLLAMAERESRAASSLARALRLTRQSVDQQTIARANLNATKKGDKPWQS